MAKSKTILAVVADAQGEVFEHPDLLMAGMNGTQTERPLAAEMIPMPEGSRLFTIPQTPPIGFDRRSGECLTAERLPKQLGGGPIQAVSAFLTPGFTRTLLPAADYQRKKMTLPLWSYTAVGWCVEEERFYVAAVQVDRNSQWQPDHFDDRKLDPLVRKALQANPDNRLLERCGHAAGADRHGQPGQSTAGAVVALRSRLSLLCRQKPFLPALGSPLADISNLQLPLCRLHLQAGI